MPNDLKSILKDSFTERELSKIRLAYDVIGDMAVINDLPWGMKSKAKLVAQAIQKVHKNVKVVAKKVGPTAGEERIRPVRVVLGEKRTEALYIENGCRFKLDVNKVYFSPRMGSERLRVINQIKPGEDVYDLFCGVGPYAIPAARRGAKVVAIDLNKAACGYAKENACLNKVSDKIDIHCGDCRKVVADMKFSKCADRVIMNLPMHAGEFLDVAFKVAKKGAVVHCYFFLHENDMYSKAEEKINTEAKLADRRVKIMEERKCGQLSSRIWRCVVDFKVLN
jgi:tRNA (guanine37-N1)-methyltransferase